MLNPVILNTSGDAGDAGDSFNALVAGDAVRPNHLRSLPLRQHRSSLIADAASRVCLIENRVFYAAIESYSCIEDTIFMVSILHC